MFRADVAVRGINSPWDAIIYRATGADPVLVALTKAIISRESEWSPSAVNPDDPSYGLMQVSAQWGYPPAELLNPERNIEIGVSILRQQVDRRPTLSLAIAAYNAGVNRTDADLQDRIDRNTLGVGEYVNDVLTYYTFFRNREPATEYPPMWEEPGVLAQVGDMVRSEAGFGVGLLILAAALAVMAE